MGAPETTDLTIEQWLRARRTLQANPAPAGFRFADTHHLVLELGRAWTPNPLPDWVTRGPEGMCFRNAVDLARSEGFTYVEGIGGPWLVDHAWCVDGDGLVVDPTWDLPETRVYWGVAFDDLEEVDRAMGETGLFGLLANDWRRGHPLLRTGELFPDT